MRWRRVVVTLLVLWVGEQIRERREFGRQLERMQRDLYAQLIAGIQRNERGEAE